MVVRAGSQPHPKQFPRDIKGSPFPVSFLSRKEQNGDVTNRDWLVWSESKEALYCLPCRLFKPSLGHQGHLSHIDGWSGSLGWKKLYDRIPDHERSIMH